MEWARYFCQWLDDWTHYRSVDDIHYAFRRHFSELRHAEAEWFHARIHRGRQLPAFLRRFIARKWGGMVIELQK